MFDTIKEWLSNLLGGATDQAQDVQQQLEEVNIQDNVDEVTQNASDQVNEKTTEFKDNFPKQ